MINKIDARQVKLTGAQAMLGSAANANLDTIFPLINSEVAKLFEDRNLLLSGGGTIAVNSTATFVTHTVAFALHVNSLVSGASPLVIDLGQALRTFSADGRMLYVVIDRTAATATVTGDAATLPAVTSANQEVVLIAKRIGTSIYFRNGQVFAASSTGTFADVGSVVDTSFVINDATDATKQIAFDAAGSTGTKTTITGTQTANRTLFLPDVNDTLAGLNSDQFLQTKRIAYSSANDSTATGSNATINPVSTGIVRLTNTSLTSVSGIPAGVSGQTLVIENQTTNPININDQETTATAANRIYTGTSGTVTMLANATFTFTYDSTAARWMLTGGSGSGSGGVANYITYGDASSGTLGWITYANGGATPSTGTGGSPLSTFTTSTTSPLRGTASYLWTKSAANRLGEGFSYAFDIADEDKGKVLQGTFSYSVVSGTFVDDDMSFFMLDVTNGVLIPCTPYKLKNHTLTSDYYFFEFQTSYNSNSYRLICHTTSASVLAYTLKFDSFNVSKQAKLYGSNFLDKVLLNQNSGTSATVASTDTLVSLANISSSRGNYVLSSNGTTIKNSERYRIKLKLDAFGNGEAVTLKLDINGTKTSGRSHTIDSNAGGSYSMIEDSFVVDLIAGDVVKFYINLATNVRTYQSAEMLIEQLTSQSVLMSSDASTRVVAFSALTNATTSVPNNAITKVNFQNVVVDTHGGYSSNNTYTVQTPGLYRVSASWDSLANTNAVYGNTIYIYKNNAVYSSNYYLSSYVPTAVTVQNEITRLMQLNVGDTIDIRFNQNSGVSAPGGTTGVSAFAVEKIQGPAQIAASEFMSAKVYGATTTIGTSATLIIYPNKIFDTNGSYSTSTGLFSVQTSGYYDVRVYLSGPSAAFTTNQTVTAYIYKNGSNDHELSRIVSDVPSGTHRVSVQGSGIVKCVAGDTLAIYMDAPSSMAIDSFGSGQNWATFTKLDR